jgi:hypothetical protein
LRAEDWWVGFDDIENVRSEAFGVTDELGVSDCTNVDLGSSNLSELIQQQLYSLYYKHTCAKYHVGCSPIGGCVNCSPGLGGPAGDHAMMVASKMFTPANFAHTKHPSKPKWLYDAGVSARSKAYAKEAGCILKTSGIVRKSSKSPLSYWQRGTNFSISKKRIRVENFIGIVKRRFLILTSEIPLSMLGMVDEITYACFMLHNFGPPIIK